MNTSHPLANKKILITRGNNQATEFSKKLIELGGKPIEVPLISFSYPKHLNDILEELKSLSTYQWLVFTSKNGVERFFNIVEKHSLKIDASFPKIAVVGKKTELALQKRGFFASVVPHEYIAEGLVDVLKPHLHSNDRILLVRGNLGRPVIKNELSTMDVYVKDLIIYETKENTSNRQLLIQTIHKSKVDIITFTSPSTVHAFIRLLEGTDYRNWIKKSVIACIGPVTKEAALNEGLPVHVCPDRYTIDDMIESIELFLLS
ncbi:uroporphyrinogen-III synthase [Bacillus timonensis]|nr:uroporphyrinogen-III synthase [Bacillus timonensis]